MNTIIQSIIDAFRKPVEIVGDAVFAHESYSIRGELLPLHWKPGIHRHVISEHIRSKDDFITFVNEYKTPQTKIFYDNEKVKAVFNYPTPKQPDYADSIVSMSFEKTAEHKTFEVAVRSKLSQKEFVRFLKRMEPFIIGLDGKQVDNMDVVEMAENLQAITKVDSVARNTASKFVIDAEVRTGKTGMTIPRIVTFEYPVYANDRTLTTQFNAELFISAQDSAMIIEIICYNIDQLVEETRREITMSICTAIERVSSYMR